ncbi:MAG: hypothetical protein ABIR96_04720 [Bdellovibrionota bacterium]
MFLGSSDLRREAPKGCFPFSFVLSLLLFFAPALGAQEVDSKVWLEALEYLTSHGASAETDTLRSETLKKRPDDLEVAEAFLEALVVRKDRLQLNSYVQALVEANECRSKTTHAKTCSGLRVLWNDRLGGLLFYEASAPRWEKARRALEAGDCRIAQAELKEIEAREGIFPDLLSKKILVAQCLGDTESVVGLNQDLEKLRF